MFSEFLFILQVLFFHAAINDLPSDNLVLPTFVLPGQVNAITNKL